MDEPVVEVERTINADADTVWRLMTSSRSPMFPGTEIETDWQAGQPFTLRGEWQGKAFTDYGEIEVITEAEELRLSHWSGTPERPASYHVVRYRLTPEGEQTRVTLAQFNKGEKTEIDEATREEFRKNWGMMLDGLKAAAEQ